MPASPTSTARSPRRRRASKPGAIRPPTSAPRSCSCAAGLIRERGDQIAPLLMQEQGKPLAEACVETLGAADNIEWLADEGRRVYGRIVPSRNLSAQQLVMKEPVGPVAAIRGFDTLDEAIAESNRLPFGLAGYAFATSIKIRTPTRAPRRSRHAMDQPARDAVTRNALRQREGFGLRFGRRSGGCGGLSEHQGGVDHGGLISRRGSSRPTGEDANRTMATGGARTSRIKLPRVI